ncbi:MAG: uncharacterized membrane protein YqaE (UPF0057 family) [Flammeovirgaceae bacterium]|jgi:uncharacterized membrane protein YqaE (UPF0057 family)
MKLTLNSFFVAILCLIFTPSFASSNYDSSNPTSEEKVESIIKDYKKEWKEMNRKEKRETRKGLKQLMKDAKNTTSSSPDLLIVLVSFFIPPLGMLAYEDWQFTDRVLISLLLTILLWLPGMIYTMIQIFK